MGKENRMSDEREYKHWCGNCQIRIYIQRHYGITLTWQDCPYACEYAMAMRGSTMDGLENPTENDFCSRAERSEE